MANKKISELPASGALTGAELVELVQGGINKKTTTQDIADLGAGGGGTVTSVSGTASRIAVDLTNPAVPVLNIDPAYDAAITAEINAAVSDLATKVDKEDFATLTFASPTVWACNNRQAPLSKLTATGDFTIDMTNVKSGSQGILKITASTASAFTITFDTTYTNVEASTNATLLNYTFPANNGAVYFTYFVADGTTLSWVILDVTAGTAEPSASVARLAAQSIGSNDITVPVSFDTEVFDSASIWGITPNPPRLVVPGSGNFWANGVVMLQWAVHASATLRRIRIAVNGVDQGIFGHTYSTAGALSIITCSFMVPVVGGDYLEITPYQLSGAALSLDVARCQVSFKPR